MSVEQNRKTAVDFLLAFREHGVRTDMLSADFEYWSPMAGTLDAAAFKAGVDQFAALMNKIHAFTIVGTTAEGDRVAVECVGDGKLKNGRRYDNTYHFLIEMKNGKVRRLKEYLDTKYTHDTFSA